MEKIMNTKSNKTLSILMLLAGSLLVGFSMGRWLAPLAAWIGPVLIIRFARDHKAGRGFLLVLIAYILAVFIAFGQFFDPPIGIFIVFGNGFLFSLPYLADRMISPRLRGFSSTFVFPLAATTLEFLFIYSNPLGSWGATGFTQYGNILLMQLASVTGMIGITFLMAWFASIANWAWENREHSAMIFRGLAAFGTVFAVVFIFGLLRLNLAPISETEETVRVAGITAQSLDTVFEQATGVSDPIDMQPILLSHLDSYFNETVREAQAGAQLVVWPELSATALGQDGEAALIARAKQIAIQYEIYLVLPVFMRPLDSSESYWNKLLLIDPSGDIVIEHVKFGGSIMETGRMIGNGQLQSVSTPFGMLSGVICYDLDYPAVIRQVGQNGTGLLLVPSKDWIEIDPVHSHMAVFRAIENGTSLVRQVDAGLSIASDPYGRVLAQTDYFGATDKTMVVQVPVKHVATIYSLFGHWLEWLAPIGFLFIVALALINRRPVK
jgi:apolipoprotein N-acyltransferase